MSADEAGHVLRPAAENGQHDLVVPDTVQVAVLARRLVGIDARDFRLGSQPTGLEQRADERHSDESDDLGKQAAPDFHAGDCSDLAICANVKLKPTDGCSWARRQSPRVDFRLKM